MSCKAAIVYMTIGGGGGQRGVTPIGATVLPRRLNIKRCLDASATIEAVHVCRGMSSGGSERVVAAGSFAAPGRLTTQLLGLAAPIGADKKTAVWLVPPGGKIGGTLIGGRSTAAHNKIASCLHAPANIGVGHICSRIVGGGG